LPTKDAESDKYYLVAGTFDTKCENCLLCGVKHENYDEGKKSVRFVNDVIFL